MSNLIPKASFENRISVAFLNKSGQMHSTSIANAYLKKQTTSQVLPEDEDY